MAFCFENEINYLIIIYQLFGEGAKTLAGQRFQNILHEILQDWHEFWNSLMSQTRSL